MNRVAVVTGAARGIGAATARRLAADGARVALVDLDADACGEVAAQIDPTGANARAYACDVSDEAGVESVFATVGDELGPVHTLVNNAGVLRDNLLHKMSVEDWDLVMNVHLRGAFLCSRAAQRQMVPAGAGRIVNTSSVSALGNRGQANYGTAKMGIQGFTRTLAIELGPFGINVNAVAPGFITTEMSVETAQRVGLSLDELQARSAAVTPLRRVGTTEDVANVIAFLAGDASAFMTGQTLYVDGGRRL